MTIIEALIFGIVQGIAEFLPISSTAHIVIAQMLFGYTFPGLSFEIILHLGSVAAVILFFRKDIIHLIQVFFRFLLKRNTEDRPEFLFILFIIIATFITGALGIILEGAVGDGIKTPFVIAGSLTLTGIFLILIERFHRIGTRTEKEMTILDSIVVGLAQTLAVLPGISRSGTTLIAGLYAGLSRKTAVRYSFLLSIPVIAGSSVLAIGDLTSGQLGIIGYGPIAVALIASFITSYIGIIWLIDFLNKGRLIYFAVYCFVLAALVIGFLDAGTVIDV